MLTTKLIGKRIEGGVAGHGVAIDLQRKNRGLKAERCRHPSADDKTRRPADDERPRVEPARVEPDDDRGNGLADPYAAEQLQLDRILQRQKNDEKQARRT